MIELFFVAGELLLALAAWWLRYVWQKEQTLNKNIHLFFFQGLEKYPADRSAARSGLSFLLLPRSQVGSLARSKRSLQRGRSWDRKVCKGKQQGYDTSRRASAVQVFGSILWYKSSKLKSHKGCEHNTKSQRKYLGPLSQPNSTKQTTQRQLQLGCDHHGVLRPVHERVKFGRRLVHQLHLAVPGRDSWLPSLLCGDAADWSKSHSGCITLDRRFFLPCSITHTRSEWPNFLESLAS